MNLATKLCAVTALSIGIGFAQPGPAEENSQANQPKYFHLDFVVKEVDEGRVVNSRTYSTMISTDPHFGNRSVRAGSKVPVPNGTAEGFSFIDVGVSFDCYNPVETDHSLMLGVNAEVSNFALDSQDKSDRKLPSVIRQNRWNSGVVVPLRKPTTIFSSDDLVSKRKMQVELTATPVQP